MSNNLLPPARAFSRACHQNDVAGVQSYLLAKNLDVGVAFRGLNECANHRAFDAFNAVFDVIASKFKTHALALQQASGQACETLCKSPPFTSAHLQALNRVLPLTAPKQLGYALDAAVNHNFPDGVAAMLAVLPRNSPQLHPTFERWLAVALCADRHPLADVLFPHANVEKTLDILKDWSGYYSHHKTATLAIERLLSKTSKAALLDALPQTATDTPTRSRKM